MRRIGLSLLTLVLLGGITTTLAPSASAGGPCSESEVQVRGLIVDASTNQPLDEVTSVELSTSEGAPVDGFGTEPNSRYSFCIEPGTYELKFVADHYRPEWWNNQFSQAAATDIVVAGPGPVVASAALTPKGRVIAGRVTNLNGRVLPAGVAVWRRNPTTGRWFSYDGIANNEGGGWYKFVAPGPGLYRIAGYADHHTSRWYDNKTRLRFAQVINLTPAGTVVTNAHIKLPFCTTAEVICYPAGFNS
jgi:hypothetical protein